MTQEQQLFYRKLQERLGFLGELSIVRHGSNRFGEISVCLQRDNQTIFARYSQHEVYQVMHSETKQKDDFIERIYWEFSQNLKPAKFNKSGN